MPVPGNVHPIKIENIDIFFRDVISLLARVVILLIDTARQPGTLKSYMSSMRLYVNFLKFEMYIEPDVADRCLMIITGWSTSQNLAATRRRHEVRASTDDLLTVEYHAGDFLTNYQATEKARNAVRKLGIIMSNENASNHETSGLDVTVPYSDPKLVSDVNHETSLSNNYQSRSGRTRKTPGYLTDYVI